MRKRAVDRQDCVKTGKRRIGAARTISIIRRDVADAEGTRALSTSRKSPFDIVNRVFARLPVLEIILRRATAIGCEAKPMGWDDNDVNTIPRAAPTGLLENSFFGKRNRKAAEKELYPDLQLSVYLLLSLVDYYSLMFTFNTPPSLSLSHMYI